MRQVLLALASANVLGTSKAPNYPEGFTPTTGICKASYTRGTEFKNPNPTCQGDAGSFDATLQGLTNLVHCATFVKEKCGEGYYASFHQAEANFLDGSTAECAYFKACPCISDDTCKQTASYTTQYVTGKVSEVLPGQTVGDGIEPPANANDPVDASQIQGITEDPTVRLAEAKGMLAKAEAPKEADLMTIPDAAEIDMKSLRENPSAIMAEAKSIGQIEPDCPEQYTTAKRRGEWMCMHPRGAFGDVTMYVIGASAMTWCVCVVTMTMVGRRVRSKPDDDGEEEEEEEEEDY